MSPQDDRYDLYTQGLVVSATGDGMTGMNYNIPNGLAVSTTGDRIIVMSYTPNGLVVSATGDVMTVNLCKATT